LSFYAGFEYEEYWSYIEASKARKLFGGVRVMRLARHINGRSLQENTERAAPLNSFHGDESLNKYLEGSSYFP
jgi:hypothetical protein